MVRFLFVVVFCSDYYLPVDSAFAVGNSVIFDWPEPGVVVVAVVSFVEFVAAAAAVAVALSGIFAAVAAAVFEHPVPYFDSDYLFANLSFRFDQLTFFVAFPYVERL